MWLHRLPPVKTLSTVSLMALTLGAFLLGLFSPNSMPVSAQGPDKNGGAPVVGADRPNVIPNRYIVVLKA